MSSPVVGSSGIFAIPGVSGVNDEVGPEGGVLEGGTGVHGASTRGVGVVGEVAQRGDRTAGVLGRHKDRGVGVQGEGFPGVVGICAFPPGTVGGVGEGSGGPQGSFAGVRGFSEPGPGIFGAGGYGGQFRGTGTTAQLHLVPATTAGRPTTGFHRNGEIFLDQKGTLFVCVADGTPGTWRRGSTQSA